MNNHIDMGEIERENEREKIETLIAVSFFSSQLTLKLILNKSYERGCMGKSYEKTNF